MKKIFPLFLALTVLTGCNEETEPTPGLTPVGGVISLRSESVLKNEPAAKAATHSETAAGQRLTYTFEAWTKDANPRCVLHKTANGTFDEAAIEIALVPGTYDFLFWADYGTGAYTTADLRQIKMSEPQTVTVAFPNTTVNSATVGEDFLFVPSNAGQSVGLSITVGDVTKGIDMLQLQRNYATSVTATFE